mmetsp:Transcript_22767/g.38127  ORF Transcript_22767/g.38127 Transcript_22767/m.38127 type:complete len:104 (+) Transcript_22767:197-508(+)
MSVGSQFMEAQVVLISLHAVFECHYTRTIIIISGPCEHDHTIDIHAFPNYTKHQQQRFNQMSTSIVGRIDEMGNRIDDLEKSIGDLMQQAGVDPKRSLEEDGK